MDAAELLTKATMLYRVSQEAYRHARLDVGYLLHEFVFAHLKQGDGISEPIRLQNGFTRRRAIELAAESLGVTRAEIKYLISSAMVRHLLGTGLDLKDLSLVSVYRFAKFIRRTTSSTGTRHSHYNKSGDYDISETEVWSIRPGLEESAPALLRRAVEEGWTQSKTIEETAKLRRGRPTPRCRKKWGREKRTAIETVERTVQKASPGDVAELCFGIVSKAEDPAAVAIRLRVMLESLLSKKKRKLDV